MLLALHRLPGSGPVIALLVLALAGCLPAASPPTPTHFPGGSSPQPPSPTITLPPPTPVPSETPAPARPSTATPTLTHLSTATPTLTPTPDVSLLQRRPYLMSLTGTALVIGWTTSSDVPGEVRIGERVYPATRRALPSGAWQHEAPISGLQPGTAYSYTVTVSGRPAYIASFRTAPTSGPVTFVAFGDAGSGSASQQAVRDRLAQTPFDLALIAGDIVYDRGTYAEFETRYFAVYAALIDHLPFYTAPGNHDYATDRAAPYLALFSLPRQALREPDQERYYSFDYGDVHFVALDTNAPLEYVGDAATDDMADWLMADLRQTTRPWKVVFLHHPPYSSGLHGSQALVRDKLVPLFEQGGVNLVIAGHDHNYERTLPIRGDRAASFAEGGIVYIVTGGGGAALYPLGASWFTAFSRAIHHITRVTLAGCQAQIEAIDAAGAAFDRATLQRC